MEVPHVDKSQQKHIKNGVNGDDEFTKKQPQPSSSEGGERGAQPRPVPSLPALCFRGLYLARRLLAKLTERFRAQPLSQHAMDAVSHALAVAEQATRQANISASQRQPVMWYITVPLSMFMMVVRTGLDLGERYLDRQVPENQHLVYWLETLRTRLKRLQDSAAELASPTVQEEIIDPIADEQEPSENDPCLQPAVEQESPSSAESSLSPHEASSSFNTEEELAVPETPGDKSMYFSVELKEESKEQEEKTTEVEKKEDKQEKVEEKAPEEKASEGKAEEAAAEAASGAAASREKPRPSAPPEALLLAGEAELAQAPGQPATSQQLLDAERSSRADPRTSKRAQKERSKVTKGMTFLNLFGVKLG